MKQSLPRLSMLAAIVYCSAATAQEDVVRTASGPLAANLAGQRAAASAGDRLLVQVVHEFERHASVTARLRHQATIGDSLLYGVGSYWQQGSRERIRVRMELQLAGQEASLLQVSNSVFLWVDQRLPAGRIVTRIDLRQLRADPVLSGGDLASIPPGEASWSALRPDLMAHSGGLASLLTALGENFTFLPPQAMRLALSPPLATHEMNIPVLAVVGHWRPEKLAALTGASHESNDKSPPPGRTPKIPDRFPQEVLVLVGQADLFPYRIEYRRLETARTASAEQPSAPYQLSASPLVVLELSDVTFDVPIDGGQFDYSPRDVDWVDQTAKLLERLRKQRQAEVASRGETRQAASSLSILPP